MCCWHRHSHVKDPLLLTHGNLILIHIGKCGYLSPSKNLLFTANGNRHRKLQLDKTQKSTYHGEYSPTEYLCISVPASMSHGTLQKKLQRYIKSQEYKEVCYETDLVGGVSLSQKLLTNKHDEVSY